MLKVENLTKTVDGEKVLNNISFTVNTGDKVVILSDNDIAKTALFQILSGEMEADSGTYEQRVTDLILEPKNKENPAYIFEFKVTEDKKELENYAVEGFHQIKEKKYDVELKNRGINEIIYVGFFLQKRNKNEI